MERKDLVEQLGQPFDVLIVDGITGARAARDAAHRGLRVAVIGMSDLASGTSSRSSRIGPRRSALSRAIRVFLVFEAVSERRTLMNIAPHLVNPLVFVSSV